MSSKEWLEQHPKVARYLEVLHQAEQLGPREKMGARARRRRDRRCQALFLAHFWREAALR